MNISIVTDTCFKRKIRFFLAVLIISSIFSSVSAYSQDLENCLFSAEQARLVSMAGAATTLGNNLVHNCKWSRSINISILGSGFEVGSSDACALGQKSYYDADVYRITNKNNADVRSCKQRYPGQSDNNNETNPWYDSGNSSISTRQITLTNYSSYGTHLVILMTYRYGSVRSECVNGPC